MATSKDFIVKNGLQVNGDVTFTGTLTGDGSGLTGAGVSDYNLLTNKPTIPTLTSQLTNDSGYLTSAQSFNQDLNTNNNVRFSQINVGIAGGLETIIYNDGITINGDFVVKTTDLSNYASLSAASNNFTGDIQIDGDLTVSGTTVTINATNLAVQDNMIYLNNGSTVANPDLGITGNYNDGTYLHAGIFRDATDGKWKFFDSYVPEPDASAYIDTTHPSFHIADVHVGNLYTGSTGYNGTVYANSVFIADSPLGQSPTPGNLSYAGQDLAFASSISAVGTTGSYNDLTDKPFIPTDLSQLTDNTASYATSAQLATKQDSLSVTIGGAAAWVPTASELTIPSRTSHLTNDSGFITSYTETSTLDNVLSRGNISTTSITVGGLSSFNGATRTVNILNTGDATFNGSLGIGTNASGTAGEIRATNNITAYYSSDARLKENIKDVDNALDIVCAIGSKTFDWTDDYIASKGGEDGYFIQKSDFGVVAQDVQAVFPQAVRTREDGTLAVDYEKLATLSFGAIQALVKRIETLESK